jgi:uncharacterized protein
MPQDKELLTRMIAQNPDIEGLAIATTDGVLVTSILPEIIDAERATFLSVALACGLALAAKLIRDVGKRGLDQLYIKGTHGYVIGMPFSDETIMVALCKPQAKLGLFFGGGSGSSSLPRSPAPDPIIPSRPPGSLRAHAKADYDDRDEKGFPSHQVQRI